MQRRGNGDGGGWWWWRLIEKRERIGLARRKSVIFETAVTAGLIST